MDTLGVREQDASNTFDHPIYSTKTRIPTMVFGGHAVHHQSCVLLVFKNNSNTRPLGLFSKLSSSPKCCCDVTHYQFGCGLALVKGHLMPAREIGTVAQDSPKMRCTAPKVGCPAPRCTRKATKELKSGAAREGLGVRVYSQCSRSPGKKTGQNTTTRVVVETAAVRGTEHWSAFSRSAEASI